MGDPLDPPISEILQAAQAAPGRAATCVKLPKRLVLLTKALRKLRDGDSPGHSMA